MEIIRPGTNINFVGGRKIAAFVSGGLIVVSLLSYALFAKFGVDFSGGTEIHLQFVREVVQDGKTVDVPVRGDEVDIGTVRKAVADLELSDESVQAYGGKETAEFLVRVQHINFGADASYRQIRSILEQQYGAEAFSEWVFDEAKDLKMTFVPLDRLSPLEVEGLLVREGALPPPADRGIPGDTAPAPLGLEGDAEAAADDDSADQASDDDSANDLADDEIAATGSSTSTEIGEDEVLDAEWIVRDARYHNGLTVALPGIAKKVEDLFAASTVLPADLECRIVQVDSIGEKVGKQLRSQGILAILVTLGLILVYVAFRFELSFAPGAVVALLHDVLIVVGVFSLCCAVFGFEFNLPIIGALMTIVGYSLNDTIVVYDRIRENVRRYKRKDLVWIVNTSINECLSRTVLTSATTFLVVLMFAIFGGPILRGFAVALLTGIVIGTYSSIFVASPTIIFLQKWLPVQQGKA